jgi:UDP-3-O-[3-hydroxymyristoyl] glucosamine N-acyltransferase
MAKLSEFFAEGEIVREGEFATLGYADSARPGSLAFADSVKHVRMAAKNAAITCLITVPHLVEEVAPQCGVVACERPRDLFYRLHETWVRESRYVIPFGAHRGMHCRIHPSAIVAPGCWIGDHVEIGELVVIREPVKIGSHAVIEPGVKVGMEGILYHRTPGGPRIIKHGGMVEMGEHCALMANSVVVRSVHDTDATRLGDGVIVGLGSVVGHEAKVGNGVVISNHCVLARRCRVQDGAFLGTGAFVREHVVVGAGAQVMAGAVVIDEVASGATVSGNFAMDHKSRLMDFTRSRLAERKGK